MPHRPRPAVWQLGLALLGVQVFDIVLHAATDQLEPLRVTANGLIGLWLAAIAAGWFSAHARLVAGLAVGGYLALNLFFLAQAGLTNPAQGGAVRVALLGLVAATTVLAGALSYARGRGAPTDG